MERSPDLIRAGHAISPLDGRYAVATEQLRDTVSEFGLMKFRAKVEIEWLKTLGSGVLPGVSEFSQESRDFLDEIADNFDDSDYLAIKQHEKTTNHDVKSVEYWLRDRIADNEELAKHAELVHFGCTSEDINNLAYGLMLAEVRDAILIPEINKIGKDLEAKAHKYADTSMLSMTHGQPATPTTLGKEYAVFVDRVSNTVTQIGAVSIMGKFSGAVGNFAAHEVTYPTVEWPDVARQFVENLGLKYSVYTTQIEPHDYQAELYDAIARLNKILTDLSKDSWQYISRGVLKQAVKEGEVGSSAMPHKVNPIDYENAEGNFGIAQALLQHMSNVLQESRMQRDLSDSTVQRNIGTAMGHTLVGFKSLQKGLGKVEPNLDVVNRELADNPQVLAEAVQTVLRAQNVENAYDIIKQLTRGQDFSMTEYRKLISDLDIPEEAKQSLLKLEPASYIGCSAEIARSVSYTGL